MPNKNTLLSVASVSLPTGVGAVIAGLTAPAPYHAYILWFGLVLIALSVAFFVWALFTPAKKELPIVGDNYTNNGFAGHMGPTINNYGKPEFQLTPDLIRQVVEACPVGKPVVVKAVGARFDKWGPMQKAIAKALHDQGFAVREFSVGMQIPAPQRPLSVDCRGAETIVEIAPDA